MDMERDGHIDGDGPARRQAPEVPGYDVGRCLGRGGNASVWLVTARPGGGKFALKCVASHTGAGPEDQEREDGIRREVRILSALDHDHLLRAHAVVRLGGGEGFGLVLDLAAGGSLAELIAGRGSLGAGETVTVLTPIAQALAYLHGQGFTHGDVSPGNVLFTALGKPLLADLGMARMVADAGGRAGAGTDGFRDPAPVDAVRAGLAPDRDVYSLAALGWYCLTGRAPESGAARPPLPLVVPGVPAPLVAALESGLADDRRQRPAAADFAAAVYRSAPAVPVDLSVSVHPTVIPQLLTRRTLPRSRREVLVGKLLGCLRAAAVAGSRRGLVRESEAATSARRAVGPSDARPAPRHGGRSPDVTSGRVPARLRTRRAAAVILALLLAGGVAVAAWLFAAGRLPMLLPSVDQAAGQPAAPAADQSTGQAAAPVVGLVPESTRGDKPSGGMETGAADAAVSQVRLRALLAAADPEDAVRGLAELRAQAWGSGDFRLLEQVNVPASVAAAADARISSRLSAAGHVLVGFSTVLTRVEALPGNSPARAVVAVSATSSAYQERNAAGAVVAEVGAGVEQRMRLVLVRVDGSWRIQDILADPIPAG